MVSLTGCHKSHVACIALEILWIVHNTDARRLKQPLARNVASTSPARLRFLAAKYVRGTERRAVYSKLGTSCVVGVIIGAKGEGDLVDYKAEVLGVSQSGKGKGRGCRGEAIGYSGVCLYHLQTYMALQGSCWIPDWTNTPWVDICTNTDCIVSDVRP